MLSRFSDSIVKLLFSNDLLSEVISILTLSGSFNELFVFSETKDIFLLLWTITYWEFLLSFTFSAVSVF